MTSCSLFQFYKYGKPNLGQIAATQSVQDLATFYAYDKATTYQSTYQ